VLPLLGLLAVPALVAALEIDWFTIDGGGGTSTAGNLTLHGTVGQADAGPLEGGGFTLKGGFWPAAGTTATGAPELAGSPGLPSVARLSLAAPNPFRDRSTFEFDLPRESRATIRVYDITGRLVKALVEDELPAGSHRAVWDGRDGQGLRVASGVYLVRMQADGFGATRKLTRLE
jgi:hypothetical protein